ncbi:MAG: DMT family transporter [Bacteroidales bacterium]
MGADNHLKDAPKAYLYAGFAVLLWSTAASAFKLTLDELNFIQVLFFSTLTSCFILFLILLFQRKLHLLGNTTRQEYLYSALLGFLNPFLYYLVLLKAYSLLPAQVAQPLNFTWPLMLVILSVPLLKQPISSFSIVTMIISFAGVYLISSQGSPFDLNFADPFGVSLALGSSVVWALFWIYNVRDKRQAEVKLFLSFFFAFIMAGIVMLATSGFSSISWNGILGSVYIGLFEMGITFVFWLKALQYASSTDKISNMIFITPFFSLVLINLVVGESIHVTTVGGLILIIAGILLQKIKG